jgi:hypothetical protein
MYQKKRARACGLPFPGVTGIHNAITDVPGVEVGYTTIIQGEGAVEIGKGPVRTGVTAILPRGKQKNLQPIWAGSYSLNGNGEMTGMHWVNDGGYFLSPICLSNTHAVGICHHATTRWMIEQYRESFQQEHLWAMPVIGASQPRHPRLAHHPGCPGWQRNEGRHVLLPRTRLHHRGHRNGHPDAPPSAETGGETGGDRHRTKRNARRQQFRRYFPRFLRSQPDGFAALLPNQALHGVHQRRPLRQYLRSRMPKRGRSGRQRDAGSRTDDFNQALRTYRTCT